MSKILFTPFSIAGGALAGIIAKKLFAGVWSAIDKQGPPDSKTREAPWSKVIAALLLEGAIFRVVRGAVDRASRQWFSRLTGSWPGEQQPKAR